MRPLLSLSLIFLFALLSMGCESRITGKEGLLSFAYTGPGDSADFNRPVAVGAYQELRVREAVNLHSVTLLEAGADPEGIFLVHEVRDHAMVLHAESEGRTEISATARLADGTEVTDYVDLRAREASRLSLNHGCTDQTRGHYLTDSRILVPFGLFAVNDERLTGYGYHPFEIAPDDVLDLKADHPGQFNLHFQTGSEPGLAVLTPEIDGEPLEIALVHPEDIDGIEVRGNQDARVNHRAILWPLLSVGDDPVCQTYLDFTIEVLTADVCSLHTAGLPDDPENEEETISPGGLISVEGRSPGECRVLFSVDDVNAGEGLSTEAVVTITH